eukprot:11048062-Alexandrium_andersonii.AAC.1
MMLMRREHVAESEANGKVFRYLMADSSPQAGFDWLWSQLREVPESRAVAACRALNSLCLDVEAFCRRARAGDDEWQASYEPEPSWRGRL